jgi:hypothetical protein
LKEQEGQKSPYWKYIEATESYKYKKQREKQLGVVIYQQKFRKQRTKQRR